MHFVLQEVIGKASKVTERKVDVVPIKISRTARALLHGRSEVSVDCALHVLVLGLPTRPTLDSKDEVLAVPGVDFHMEVLCVGIAIFQVPHVRTFSLAGALNGRQTNDTSL